MSKKVRFNEKALVIEATSPVDAAVDATVDTEVGIEVPGRVMDNSKIQNKSGLGRNLSDTTPDSAVETAPMLCKSLSNSRLYMRRKNAENNKNKRPPK